MTEHEKLYDLIVDAENEFYINNHYADDSKRIESVVEYLIAHGATVKEPQKPLAWVDVIELGKLHNSIVWIEESKENWTSPNTGWNVPVSLKKPDGEGVYRFTGEIDFYAPGIETEICCTKSCYGKIWRCWAKKPTEAERKAAEWEK